eukprot:3755942-Prymnesium_polylepis.1
MCQRTVNRTNLKPVPPKVHFLMKTSHKPKSQPRTRHRPASPPSVSSDDAIQHAPATASKSQSRAEQEARSRRNGTCSLTLQPRSARHTCPTHTVTPFRA